jgi:hypothetical protein
MISFCFIGRVVWGVYRLLQPRGSHVTHDIRRGKGSGHTDSRELKKGFQRSRRTKTDQVGACSCVTYRMCGEAVRRKNGPFLRRRNGLSLENEITAWPPTDGPLGTCLEPLGTERAEKAPPEGWSATPPAHFLQVRSGFCIRLGPRLEGLERFCRALTWCDFSMQHGICLGVS